MYVGIPGGASGRDPTCQCGKTIRDTSSVPRSGRSLRGRTWQPTPVFLPGESHGQRSLAGYSPWGHRESDTAKATRHGIYKCLEECVNFLYFFLALRGERNCQHVNNTSP